MTQSLLNKKWYWCLMAPGRGQLTTDPGRKGEWCGAGRKVLYLELEAVWCGERAPLVDNQSWESAVCSRQSRRVDHLPLRDLYEQCKETNADCLLSSGHCA